LSTLNVRLNSILEKITSKEFLNNEGLGNEIGFYIFDYDPSDELEVRKHVTSLLRIINKQHTDLKVGHVDLFRLIIDYLKERKLLTKAIDLQKKRGNKELLKAIRPVLEATKISEYFFDKIDPKNKDLVIVYGVGGAYPLIRSHNLLNNLHKIMDSTPLIMFYPGVYNGNDLRLFGKLKESNYYRAFRLIT